MSQPIPRRIAELYDISVPDWPGEIDFYRDLAKEATSNGGSILDVACGTGRVAVRLAQDGTGVVGIDFSPAMLDMAREKSAGIPNVRWVEGDIRRFDLGETFPLAIIPGHSFLNLLTPADQVSCLESIKRHLVPGGRLIVHLDHQNIRWLSRLTDEERGVFGPAEELSHPKTGRTVRTAAAWSYEPSTQTATYVRTWEEIGADGNVADRWERGPIPLHSMFRYEMEHLLTRVGFAVEAVYGDFYRGELRDESSEMIWVARVGP